MMRRRRSRMVSTFGTLRQQFALVFMLLITASSTQWRACRAQQQQLDPFSGKSYATTTGAAATASDQLYATTGSEAISASYSFVQTRGKQFALNGQPMYVNGANIYWLMVYGANPYTKYAVTDVLQQAAGVGLNVVRTWAFNDGNDYNALQTSPGVFNENVFQGLDFAISEAKRLGIRLILSLVNNNPSFGGKQQYVQWARQYQTGANLPNEDAFYTDPTIISWYQNMVKTVLTRVNTVTGVAYRNEPAIFAWELINEPRCISDPTGNILQTWILDMASYVKSLDSNHLLEVGLEGFYGSQTFSRATVNPDSYFTQLGTDFIRNNQVWAIDFTTVHSYPDLWMPQLSEPEMLAFMQNWVTAHIQDTGYLQKPVLFSEFGKSSWTPGFYEGERDNFMSLVYDAIYNSAMNQGPGAGALVWQLTTASLLSNTQDGFAFVLSQNPSTAAIMQSQSYRMAQIT